MSKYQRKANEILGRIQALVDAFEIRKGENGWPDDYEAPYEVLEQFPEIVLDIQTLLFCDSPQHPLYVQAMKLNDRVDIVMSSYGDRFSYSDFEKVKELVSKYIQYLSFLEEEG